MRQSFTGVPWGVSAAATFSRMRIHSSAFSVGIMGGQATGGGRSGQFPMWVVRVGKQKTAPVSRGGFVI
jgi:hypothetical protein